jgi:hypothetical protein
MCTYVSKLIELHFNIFIIAICDITAQEMKCDNCSIGLSSLTGFVHMGNYV